MSRSPDLHEGAVHVWRCDIDAGGGDDSLSALSSRERERARRIVDLRRRARWARSRGLLRVLLGEYLGAEPRALEFVAGASGKLALVSPALLHFNVAHSGPIALYAISRAGEVGVDVEVPRTRGAREIAVATRAFGAAEARRLALIAPADRALEFRRLWVRHEAALKCSGEGVFAAQHAARARLGTHEPWTRELDLGEGVLGAVAIARPPRELACFVR